MKSLSRTAFFTFLLLIAFVSFTASACHGGTGQPGQERYKNEQVPDLATWLAEYEALRVKLATRAAFVAKSGDGKVPREQRFFLPFAPPKFKLRGARPRAEQTGAEQSCVNTERIGKRPFVYAPFDASASSPSEGSSPNEGSSPGEGSPPGEGMHRCYHSLPASIFDAPVSSACGGAQGTSSSPNEPPAPSEGKPAVAPPPALDALDAFLRDLSSGQIDSERVQGVYAPPLRACEASGTYAQTAYCQMVNAVNASATQACMPIAHFPAAKDRAGTAQKQAAAIYWIFEEPTTNARVMLGANYNLESDDDIQRQVFLLIGTGDFEALHQIRIHFSNTYPYSAPSKLVTSGYPCMLRASDGGAYEYRVDFDLPRKTGLQRPRPR